MNKYFMLKELLKKIQLDIKETKGSYVKDSIILSGEEDNLKIVNDC